MTKIRVEEQSQKSELVMFIHPTVYPAYYSLTNVVVLCLIRCRISDRFMVQNVFYRQKKASLKNVLNEGSANYIELGGQIWPPACFDMAHEPRIVFTCLNEKEIKNNIL